MSKLSSSVLILVVTKIQVHTLENSQGSLSLVILLQSAVNEKINESLQTTKSTQFAINCKTSSLMSELSGSVP